jgi:hypothetical protein
MRRLNTQASCHWLIAVAIAAPVFAVGCGTTPSSSAESANKAQVAAQTATAVLEGRQGATPNNSPKSVSTKGPPSWLTEFSTDPNYFIGIAGSPDTGNSSSDIDKARKNARNALAAEIETTIHSDTNLESRDNSKGDAQDSLTMLINEKVNLRLNGVQLVDSYHSPKMGYWFYYRLPRQALDPRPTISQGVHELAGQLHSAVTLSFGSITYEDTGLSSAFSLYLEDQILLALRSERGITVTAKLFARVVKDKGAGKESADSERDTRASEVVLTGTFFRGSAGKVPVFLRLTDWSTDEIIASGSFVLDQSSLPASLWTLPENYSTAISTKEEIAALQPSPDTTFRVRLWTDRGEGATFLDGEDLVVNFSATHDCYLKMYHVDVNGHVALVLPNQYWQNNFFRAGQVYQIPPRNAPYRFQLHTPFGVEFIKVIASTVQFDELEQSFTDLGPVTRGLLTRGLSVTASGPTEKAEALVSYTILER